MAHKIDLVMDFQYGSTGKGLIVGYLAKRENYDTAICAFATNAGHTYIDGSFHVMTQQLPVAAVVSKSVTRVLIGPGSAIHAPTLEGELLRYAPHLHGKRVMIHPQAAVVEQYHMTSEITSGRTKIGSTGKGVGEAYVERIHRHPTDHNTVKNRWGNDHPLHRFVVTEDEYRDALDRAQSIIIEGAQGFSLSMYHGQYPYTTSRDVTPMQIAADCGLPFQMTPYIQVIGTLRTFPIRVNNRDGSSGPCYPDQHEISWSDIGVAPELTTVTKLPRRVFTFSHQQLRDAMWHCGGYWHTRLFLNFCNYLKNANLFRSSRPVQDLIDQIQAPGSSALNPPHVEWLGWGPSDQDVRTAA